MATLDEIFASMPDAAAGVTHEPLIIDPDTRQIYIPDIEQVFGVETDGNAERKYFQAPRYVGDNLDLSKCKLRVLYQNASGTEEGRDAYLVDDVTIDGEYVYFSWKLSPHATLYKGGVSFLVGAFIGEEIAWHTTLATGNVLEGMTYDGEPVQAAMSDVIAQLLALVEAQSENVEAVGAAQVEAVKKAAADAQAAALAEIEAKGKNTLATIPADYTAMEAAVATLERTAAPGIVCAAEGETIQVHDSADKLLQGLRLFGKTEQVKTTGAQLLPIVEDNTKTDRGLTQVVTGGVCTVRGRADSTAAFNLTLYGSYYNTEPVFTLAPGTYTAKDCMVVSSDGTTQKKYENTTFTLAEELGVTWVATRSYQSGEMVAETTYPMLNAGEAALPWEPYSGGMASPCPEWPQELESIPAPVVTVCGKNLIPNINSKTIGGITFTANSDGSFTVNGTADAYRNGDSDQLDATPYRGKTVTLSGKRTFGQGLALQLFSKCASGNVFNTITGDKAITFKIPEDAITISLQCYVTNNATVDNVVIYPQLELGDKETAFEPYKVQKITVANGLPGIPVASGGNYTDADGQQWLCDEVDLGRGVYVQRVKTTRLENMAVYDEAKHNFQKTLAIDMVDNYNVIQSQGRSFVTHYTYTDRVWNDASLESGYVFNYRGIFVRDVRYTSLDDFNAYLADNEVHVLYELANPVETALTEAELAAFAALRSYKPNTTLLNDAGAHMAAEYVADTKLYIDNALAALIAGNA